MDKKLYYCEYWQKKNILTYSYCLSNLMFWDEKNTSMAQIHGIILQKNLVLTYRKEQLSVFEDEIKFSIRKIYNDSIIKIWYYKEDDSIFDTEHIPSRFAITIQVPDGMQKENLVLLSELENCVINQIIRYI